MKDTREQIGEIMMIVLFLIIAILAINYNYC